MTALSGVAIWNVTTNPYDRSVNFDLVKDSTRVNWDKETGLINTNTKFTQAGHIYDQGVDFSRIPGSPPGQHLLAV
jgi:hypothetical protein